MGYLVPETKKQLEYVLNTELAGALTTPEMVATMTELAEAYQETDAQKFNQNKEKYFSSLHSMLRLYGIDLRNKEAKEEQELALFDEVDHFFPEDQKTQENFKQIFNKLWKSISLAENFKKDYYAELIPEPNVAKIYQNYLPVYDEILKQTEMHNGLDRSSGRPVGTARPVALRNMMLIADKHKNDEPFRPGELADVRREAIELNRSFSVYNGPTMIDSGMFDGDRIQTPEDLRNYIAKYETMLCDQMEANGRDLYIFAQGYAKLGYQGESVKRLNEDDLRAVNRKIEAFEKEKELDRLEADLKPFLQELRDLQDFDRVKEFADQTVAEYRNELQKSFQDINRDPEVQAAQKAYDKQQAAARDELVTTTLYLKGGKRLPLGVERRFNDQYDAKNVCDPVETNISLAEDRVSPYDREIEAFSKEVKTERKAFEKKAVGAQNAFVEAIEKQTDKDLPEYNKEVQQKLKDIETKREELLQDPFAPDYKQKKQELQDQIESLKGNLKYHIFDYNKDRINAKYTLKNALKPFQENMKASYQKEKQFKIDRLEGSTRFLHTARQELKSAYSNTRQGKAVAEAKYEKAHRELSKQLMDICEAMDSVKKVSIFGNSAQYDAMLKAIKDYRDNKIDAKKAQEACLNYLNLSSDGHGGLEKMTSQAGKIRKQSCVRMMELLEDAPDLEKIKTGMSEIGEFALKKDEDLLEKEVRKEKIDFDTLKASLARKSGEVTADADSKDAKAYSNLNAKLGEIKKAKEDAAAAKKASKSKKVENPSIKNNPEGPAKAK